MSEIFEDIHALNVRIEHVHSNIALLRVEMKELEASVDRFRIEVDNLKTRFNQHGHSRDGDYA